MCNLFIPLWFSFRSYFCQKLVYDHFTTTYKIYPLSNHISHLPILKSYQFLIWTQIFLYSSSIFSNPYFHPAPFTVTLSLKCNICLGEAFDPYKLTCKHEYCKSCLQAHFTSLIRNKSNLTCPDCWIDLTYSNAKNDIVNGELLQMYEQFELQKKVDRDPNLHWWPKTDCNKYVEVHAPAGVKWRADCEWGMSFCINWHQAWHPNSSWKIIDKANKQFYKRSEVKWCPQCQTTIEKNDGCLHMTCSVWLYQFWWNWGEKYTYDHFSGLSPWSFADHNRPNIIWTILLVPIIMFLIPFALVYEWFKAWGRSCCRWCTDSWLCFCLFVWWFYILWCLVLLPISLAFTPFVIIFVVFIWIMSKIKKMKFKKFNRK